MGYKRKAKTYVLQFENEEYEGLEIRAKGASVEQLMSLMSLARFGSAGAKFGQEDIREVDGLFELFASKLTEWNLEDEDGVPVSFEPQMVEVIDPTWNAPKPDQATGAVLLDPPMVKRIETPTEAKTRALKSQDMDFALDVVLAWVGSVLGASAPLEKGSPDGEQFPEGSIPMETPSSSL
jgi:hypothetical protein